MSARLDRLQRGLFEAFAGLADNVVWVQGEVPRELLGADLLSLRLTAGPTPHNQQHARGALLEPADSVFVKVTAATAGVRNRIRLNGYEVSYDVLAGNTVTTVRNALLAKLAELAEPGVTIAADGNNRISFVAAGLGDLRELVLGGELVAEGAVFSGESVLVTEGTVTHLVTLQAFAQGREPRSGAWDIMQRALDVLQHEDAIELLAAYGLAIWDRGALTDLSAIAGGHWESRCACDLTVAMRSTSVQAVGAIEHVTTKTVVGSTTITASADAP